MRALWLFIALMVSSCAAAQLMPWPDDSSIKGDPREVVLRGQLVRWSLSALLLCPDTSQPPLEPPFTDCIDIVGPPASDLISEEFPPRCVVVRGKLEAYSSDPNNFVVPSGYLMSKLGVLEARTIMACGSGR
jgi:hypothetical protein